MEGHNFLRTLLHFISIHNRYIQAGLMHIQKKYNFQKNKRRVSIISSKERLYFCKEISFYLQLKLNTSFLYKISHLTISSKAFFQNEDQPFGSVPISACNHELRQEVRVVEGEERSDVRKQLCHFVIRNRLLVDHSIAERLKFVFFI